MGVVRKFKSTSKIACIFLSLMLMASMFGCMPVMAEGGANSKTDDTPVDFVLVLDCSGSMKDSDKNDLTTSAAKMFVDMLPAENSRLSIVAFGNEYADAYNLQQIGGGLAEDFATKTPLGANQVKVARDLEDITTQELKQQAKNQIDEIVHQEKTGNNYTPVGYALETACKILTDHETEQSSAAIILLSDGRVTGQAETDSYEEGLKSHSVDRAVDVSRANDWPIYCMELNFDGENGKNSHFTNKRAVYEMREHIPETPDEHVELTSATQAQDEFADIFSKFFQVEPEPIEPMQIENGESSRAFNIGEMVAESNITMTSNMYNEDGTSAISQITDIVIMDPNGTSTTYNKSVEQQDRIITFDKDYITIKLMTPIAGEWKLTAHGSDGVEIGLYAVTIHEMDLQLTTTQTDVLVAKGTTIDFYASFVYHNNPYVSKTVYQKYPATLYIDGPGAGPIEMVGSEKDYSASFTFTKSGEYTVYAYVSDANLFRNGRKESGVYTFSVGNIPTEATEEKIADQDINVGGSIDDIDLTKYFTNPDNDEITYTVEYDKTVGIASEVTPDGILKLSAGKNAGEFKIKVLAKDPMMETPAEQTFMLNVVNQPLELAKGIEDGGTEKIDFSYNADSLPGFLVKLANVPKESERTVYWSDYFSDPDGLPINVNVEAEEKSDVIEMTFDAESMHVVGTGKGAVTYQVTASDSSDPTVKYTMNIEVNSRDAKALLWKMIRVPLFICLAILILIIGLLVYAFTGKKIYGTWDVISTAKTVQKRKFAVTGAGKRSKCSLNRLLKDLSVPGDFPGVELVAGNKFSKKVTVKGLDKMQEVSIGGSRVTDPAKLKKLSPSIGKGRTITLVSASNAKITLKRTL